MTRHPVNVAHDDDRTFGQRVADKLAQAVGSWRFVIGQALFFTVWVAINALAVTRAIHFDGYPFFLFNLMMSAEAAFTGPVLLMSQNRQSAKDRDLADHDFAANREALRLIKEIHERTTNG